MIVVISGGISRDCFGMSRTGICECSNVSQMWLPVMPLHDDEIAAV
jgi:hypothetical protein